MNKMSQVSDDTRKSSERYLFVISTPIYGFVFLTSNIQYLLYLLELFSLRNILNLQHIISGMLNMFWYCWLLIWPPMFLRKRISEDVILFIYCTKFIDNGIVIISRSIFIFFSAYFCWNLLSWLWYHDRVYFAIDCLCKATWKLSG